MTLSSRQRRKRKSSICTNHRPLKNSAVETPKVPGQSPEKKNPDAIPCVTLCDITDAACGDSLNMATVPALLKVRHGHARQSGFSAHHGVRFAARGVLWFGFYLVLILFPLIVGWLRHPPEVEGRAFSLLFSTACGYVAFGIMAFEFALIARLAIVSSAFGQDALLQFHRQMGMMAAVFLGLHIAFVFRNGYPVDLLIPVSEGVVQWGAVAAYAVVLLIAASIGRKRLGIPYGWWQITHWLLATSIVLSVITHILKIGSFVGPTAMKELWALYLLLILGLAVWFRLLKPVVLWRKPWEVVENIEERGNCRTLRLKPVGHPGFFFEPGQFAWINTGKTPFNREQHPISLSSCAHDEPDREVGFTIKALGDWSGQTVPSLKPGARVWLDGPYGVFTPDREQGPGYVLIAGGVGITPFYSMCRTFSERGDQRPVTLFYGADTWENLTFREHLDALQESMNLRVVYVLSKPGSDWSGERGFITADVLQRNLPRQFHRMQYFICGPAVMMDSMEKMLPEIGVPREFVHTERFNMV
jgi:predicted ferric reductase